MYHGSFVCSEPSIKHGARQHTGLQHVVRVHDKPQSSERQIRHACLRVTERVEMLTLANMKTADGCHLIELWLLPSVIARRGGGNVVSYTFIVIICEVVNQ